MVPFYASSSSSTGANKAESSLRRHWQLRIASESHSSSGRFIPLPPLVPCFIHCRCLLSSSFSDSWFLFYLPNFFFFFLSFAHFCLSLYFRLSLICLTFSKLFVLFCSVLFCFVFFFEKTIVIVSKSGVQCNSKYLYSYISTRKKDSWMVSLVWHLLKLRACTFWVWWLHNLYRKMLTNTFRVLVNNSFKKSFVWEK